ncbi:hypothetical protein B0H12DRAFT_1233624 [Mycena haematopus]|nr:hypothetical protein B0H12DRAFT_1330857 [Mycena haematopus]KAJ7253772.1 hypothetical protein B0H12DRAFT_1233624 [Mycena haematopus]
MMVYWVNHPPGALLHSASIRKDAWGAAAFAAFGVQAEMRKTTPYTLAWRRSVFWATKGYNPQHRVSQLVRTSPMERGQRITYSYGPFSGVLPHPTEIAQLHTQRIEEYDEEIAKLQSVLNKMVADRAILQNHADSYLSVSSPIRRLSNEMLLQIFEFYSGSESPRPACEIDWDGLPYTAGVGSMYCLLQYLGQVCTRWHNLVMGTPVLWAKIQMDFLNFYLDFPDEMMQLASSALKRSVLTPLDICIRGRDFDQTSGVPVLEFLARNSHRWKEARIWADEDGSQNVAQALTLAQENFPLLENLHFSGLPNGGDFFEFAPRLTEITLEYPIPPDPKLPWQQLHSLTYIEVCSPTEMAIIASQLSLCPQITRLSFRGVFIPFPPPDASVLPALVSDVHALSISLLPDAKVDKENPSFVALLGCITLRRARALLLESEHYHNPFCWSQNTFLAFSMRSSLHDTLRTLEISNVMITAQELLDSLAGLPRVEALSVSEPSTMYRFMETISKFTITDIFLRRLTWTPDSDPCVPRLHSFACKTFMKFEGNNYLDFVSSRIGPGRNADGPFQSSILYYQGVTVNALLAEGLSEFVRQKVLRSRLERDYWGAS